MWTMLEDLLFSRLRSNAQVRALLPDLERRVAEGSLSPTLAVEKIATAFGL
jgi:LAO/AO transport system kinase